MTTAASFLENNIYFDVHGHKEKTLPGIGRILSRGRMPRDVSFSEIHDTGVDGFVVCAIGDPSSFVKRPASDYTLVTRQLKAIKSGIIRAGGAIAESSVEIRKSCSGGKRGLCSRYRRCRFHG